MREHRRGDLITRSIPVAYAFGDLTFWQLYVVAFLTEAVTAQQLEMLSSLMDEKRCESLTIFG